MDSTSYMYNAMLQTIHALVSTLKFIHQIFGAVAEESFVFVKIDFFFFFFFFV
jgi:hypothetical protein